jgi:hypothetical protein
MEPTARDTERLAYPSRRPEGDMLLANVCALQRRAESILRTSETAGDLKIALAAIRELRGVLEIMARMAGELRDTPNVNLLISPEYQNLRQLIVEALAPYPEARRAVAQVLRELPDAGE